MAANKPSEAEEEFFAREEADKKRKLALSQAKALADAERERLRTLHFMRCPKCGMQLHGLGIHGVQVERCFGCNGIFLDADDVDKLIKKEGYVSRSLQFFARRDYTGDKS